MNHAQALNLIQENLDDVVTYLEELGPKIDKLNFRTDVTVMSVCVFLDQTASQARIVYGVLAYEDPRAMNYSSGTLGSNYFRRVLDEVEPGQRLHLCARTYLRNYADFADMLTLDVLKIMKEARVLHQSSTNQNQDYQSAETAAA
ncbi:hypothetical protein HOK51_04525 [Candidatus Woesearchaeota archaeon]|jgi:hypothetical protein|nr:hypothetical protein [Candidatus Woesearchaeota archaeon]MBT6519089.1 hypothetical protein [Candidatus Woesearchaeota archaeon]MBT7367032.1 hypothetical protein [Candidatus Woesearchaeota archaeon]